MSSYKSILAKHIFKYIMKILTSQPMLDKYKCVPFFWIDSDFGDNFVQSILTTTDSRQAIISSIFQMRNVLIITQVILITRTSSINNSINMSVTYGYSGDMSSNPQIADNVLNQTNN